jgi:hypothetical protein
MNARIWQTSGLAVLLACSLLAGCSSSSGGGGSSSKPNSTYIVVPPGQTAPVPAR